MLKTILFIVFISIAAFCTAQSSDIRVSGGLNLLQLSSDQGASLIDGILHDQEVSGRLGSQFALSMSFGRRLYIQPSFRYANLSTDVTSINTLTQEELISETHINAISVPVRIGYRFFKPDGKDLFNIRLFGGFDASHIASVVLQGDANTDEGLTKDDFKDLIINSDVGLGLDFFIFFFEAGYQVGLSPIFSDGDSATANAFYTNLGLRKGI